MPDDVLAASADSGKLTSDPAELGAQVERMLKDEKASTLTTHFVYNWLTLNRLKTVTFAPTVYPSFDEDLRISAATETTTFFSHLISDDLPLSNLIDADFTYANARLGKHYGIIVTGTGFSKVSLAGTPRAGILGQTSFLMGTSMPKRSSPVFRGNWILNRILCSATPPPPANVDIPTLKSRRQAFPGETFWKSIGKTPVATAATSSSILWVLGLKTSMASELIAPWITAFLSMRRGPIQTVPTSMARSSSQS